MRYDIEPLLQNHEDLKTKVFTVDRRKSCDDSVEKVYYQSQFFFPPWGGDFPSLEKNEKNPSLGEGIFLPI